MLRVRNLLLVVGLGSAFLLSSCSKDEVAAGSPLAYAPAETPYFIGNREVLPKPVMDGWWRRTEPLLASYAPMLDSLLAQIPAEGRSKHPLAFALLSEASNLRKRADFEALGLGGSTRMALYGIGLTPVLRLELADPAPLKALIARAEGKAGVKAPMSTYGSYEYYAIDASKFEVVVALGQGQLVLTGWAKGAADTIKQQVLADAPPAKNLLGTPRLEQLDSTYKFQPYGSGFVDVLKVADALLQPSNEVDKSLLTVLGYTAPELSADCQRDIRHLLGKAPQVSMGVTRFGADGMDTLTVLELDSALAQSMVPIAAQIPNVAKGAGWAGFGLGFNGQAFISFLDARATAVAADPYTCTELADLDDELKRAVQQMRSAGGFLGMAKGIAFRLDAFEMDTTMKAPKLIDMTVAVTSDAPQALLSMATMGVPQLAQLDLTANGEPKAVPLDQLPAEMSSLGAAYAVMTEKSLAVRFAKDDQGAGVKSLIDAPMTAPGTLLTYSFSGELYRLLAQLMRSGMDPSTPAEQQEQMAKLFEQYAELIGRFDQNISLTPRGVEILQTMTMK